jgi:hypothetical protein
MSDTDTSSLNQSLALLAEVIKGGQREYARLFFAVVSSWNAGTEEVTITWGGQSFVVPHIGPTTPVATEAVLVAEMYNGAWISLLPWPRQEATGGPGGGPTGLWFSLGTVGGKVVVTDQALCNPGWFPGGATVNKLEVRLLTEGVSTTTVTFYKNGVSIGTVSLVAGVKENSTVVNVAFADSDEMTVAVTVAGSGAKSLTAYAQVA